MQPTIQQRKEHCNPGKNSVCLLTSNIKRNMENAAILGISLSHLRSLLDVLGCSKEEQTGFDFYSVTEKIKRITSKLNQEQDRSYVGYVKIQDSNPESKVGFADYFVSYAWGGNFLQTVQALVDHFPGQNPYLFVDFACLDQHKIAEINGGRHFEDIVAEFQLTLRTIGEAVIVLTPGQNPLAKNRSWCCFEWAQFELLNIRHSYCVPQQDVRSLILKMKSGNIVSFDYYNNVFASVNVMKANASNLMDQKNILELIRKIGVVKVNDIVLNSIKDWFIKVCEQGLQDSTLKPEEKVNILSSYGSIYYALGQYNNSLPFLQSAVELAKILPNNMEQIATQLNNLANLLTDKGDHPGAEPLHREALALRRIVFGDEHPMVAESLNNLAVLLRKKQEFGEAEQLQNEALLIDVKGLGVDHPFVARDLNNLAELLIEKEDYDGAINLQRQALAIMKQEYGEEHPYFATTLNNLAGSLSDRGDYSDAEKLYRESLRIDKMILGADHPGVATSLNNLALLLRNKREYLGAESLHREALAIRKSVFGDEHSEVAQSLSNIAELLIVLGKREEAQHLGQEAYRIYLKILGPDHPQTKLHQCWSTLSY